MDTHGDNDMGARRMGVRDDDQGAPMVKRIPVECYSRVVGYYAQVRNWNKGKRQEWKDRKVYEVPKEG